MAQFDDNELVLSSGTVLKRGLVKAFELREFTKSSVLTGQTGASATIDISSGFPASVLLLGATLEIDTVAAGEADLACTIGDVGDPDGLTTSFTLDGVAAGWAAVAQGAEAGGLRFEAAYSPRLTLTATALGDVTAGAVTVHIFYIVPSLLT